MPKIAMIGAGSTVFAKNLIGDILSWPELADSTISLMDIDPERLRTSEIVARRLAQSVKTGVTIEATTDRRRALDGADYAVNMIQVGLYRPATVVDFEAPKKYGLRHRRHAGHRRHHARPAHHPGAARHGARHERAMP
jgi:alpha-galactosidase